MKKYLRRISGILLTVIMVLTMCLTAFASEAELTPTPVPKGVAPSKDDAITATVKNVEATATVTAYQIVRADYKPNGGFIGYLAVDGVTINNPLKPTSTEVTKIAKGDLSKLKSIPMTTKAEKGLADFTASLNAGYWMVLVSGTVNEVYNPMLVGVYYSVDGSNNNMSSDPVDADSNWTLVTTDAYAKSTMPTITKTIENYGNGGNKKGDDVAVGDTVKYQIKTNVPSYSKEYSNVTLNIKDELSPGLTLNHKEGEITVTGVPEDKYTLNATDSGFTIIIDSAWALENGKTEIKVTYSATINENAKSNFNSNTNKATLEYTNKQGVQSVTDKTYHYTFDIDGELTGQKTDKWEDITKEITKTGEEKTIKNEQGEEIKIKEPLSGATFTMTRLDNAEYDSEKEQWTATAYTGTGTKKVWTKTSDKDGQLKFTGLDAGWYELEETQAPSGYTLEGKKHYVHIIATYMADGRLESYSVTIDNAATSTYTATYDGATTTITNVNVVAHPTTISNTTISELPSTGGTGTYFFTIVGVMIMAAVAGMFFVSRRKEHDNQ